MKKNNRDDFTASIKNKLAKRVAYICSNPSCQVLTIGPDTNNGINNIGVASHIYAASPEGPRYKKTMTSEERKSIENGIWLCQSCSKLIDSDMKKYTPLILLNWKSETENNVIYNFNKRINIQKKNKLDYIFDTLRECSNWGKLEDNLEGYYFKENPNYIIKIIDEENNNREFYSYLMCNEKTHFYTIEILFNNSCIYSNQLVSLDSGNLLTIIPQSIYIDYENKTYKIKYFVNNSKELILRDFLKDFPKNYYNDQEAFDLYKLDEIITYFDDESEVEIFKHYFKSNLDKIEIDKVKELYKHCGETEIEKDVYSTNIALSIIFKNIYNNYKKK